MREAKRRDREGRATSPLSCPVLPPPVKSPLPSPLRKALYSGYHLPYSHDPEIRSLIIHY